MKNRITLLTGALVLGAAAGIGLDKPRKQFSFHGRSVIITGGSRGLGLELARQLAVQRARLTLIARDLMELKRAERELAGLGAEVLTVPCDVRQQKEVVEAVARAVTIMGRVDVLINNAGIIQVGPMDEMSLEDFEDAMAVHFFGPLYFTLAALPHMKAGGGGRIVNISSIGGKIAVPHLLPYTASKFALAGFSDGLRAELKHKNILVTTVCPGPIRTGSPRNAVIKGKYRQEFAWFSISSSLPLLSTSVERAAAKIIDGCRRGRSRVLVGAHTRFALLLNEMAPAVAAKMAAIINRMLPGKNSGAREPKMGYESHSKWSPSWLTQLNDRAAWRNNEILIRS
ncbi:MAG TPA: SDR family NAD(P)-dependent oxidoreductase [Verrucomicrobiae bacterium]|nr:SDR family NAD(P)-dependent oxidoreductase [Verrucomicrobiae bacterium]